MSLVSSERLGRVFDRASRDRVPVSGALDLTYRCNFRCAHCYGGHLATQSRAKAAEIGTQQAIDLLTAAAESGCLLLLLSGGEPLLRDDFTDIYTAAKRLGLIVTVFTNASLLTQAHLHAFAEYPPHMVEVSLYGAGDATYERVTGVRGSFRRAWAGIEQLLDRRVRVGLKTMILRENVDDVGAIEALARSLGVPFRVDSMITARLDGDHASLAQRVEPQRAVDIEMQVQGRRADMMTFFGRQSGSLEQGAAWTNRLYRCGAGVASFHVDPEGLMHPCLVSRTIAYNAVTAGFADAWKAVTKAVDRATWEGTGGCADCSTVLLCDYCPGLFELEQASPSQPPEYVCRVGESRRRAIEVEGPEVFCVGAN